MTANAADKNNLFYSL